MSSNGKTVLVKKTNDLITTDDDDSENMPDT